MASETRTVHFSVAPSLAAYLAWLDKEPGRTFDLAQYDLWIANYREEDATTLVRAAAWPELEGEGF